MLGHTRLCLPRTAVAFFNMKHFQSKQRINLTPQNIYNAFGTCLSPRDRLLRHSASGKGAGRVLVLDHQQKVKGVYVPVCSLPHPAVVKGGDSPLGIAVEDYMKLLEPLAHLQKPRENQSSTTTTASAAAVAKLPRVLVVVSHPQGLAFSIFRADGSPVFPLANMAIESSSTSPTTTSATNDPTDNPTLGRKAEITRSATYLMSTIEKFQKMVDTHATEVAACSTYYWIARDEFDSLSLRAMKSSEKRAKDLDLVQEGVAAASPAITLSANHALKFDDPRWVPLPDSFFDVAAGRNLYSRDAVTRQRTVDEQGLQTILTSGTLLLDYVPQCMRPPGSSATANGSTSAP